MGAFTSQAPITRNGFTAPPPPPPAAAPPAQKPTVGFHGAVCEFKRRLIEATLAQSGGNRTRAAKALGLQRTYLLRLMREFQIRIPPSSAPPRRSDSSAPAAPS
ncbi:MAG TPA: helix-turn-helix domain-containing protein [Methylomirabilota bacterium]|nr:helix-turn-helix domain-containing protein [Methylomirabilota bacterium]